MSNLKKIDHVIWCVMFKFEWIEGKIFTLQGVYRKINKFEMEYDGYSVKSEQSVSLSTVKRAVDKMIESGSVEVVIRKYNCYERIQYRLLETYPF